ncbi:MAG: hypothetical protein WCR23_04995 [Planctomycetota bacterium]|nr:hypothetical protein [Planctomycetia bacterium]MDO7677867.1 hypothetical protein [Pirellulales bacterium]RLS32902.1 MAG: hypothetical protein DWH80_03590 [Planctomycetota bacterium]
MPVVIEIVDISQRLEWLKESVVNQITETDKSSLTCIGVSTENYAQEPHHQENVKKEESQFEPHSLNRLENSSIDSAGPPQLNCLRIQKKSEWGMISFLAILATISCTAAWWADEIHAFARGIHRENHPVAYSHALEKNDVSPDRVDLQITSQSVGSESNRSHLVR